MTLLLLPHEQNRFEKLTVHFGTKKTKETHCHTDRRKTFVDSCPGYCCDAFLNHATTTAARLKYQLPITVPESTQKASKISWRATLSTMTLLLLPLEQNRFEQ